MDKYGTSDIAEPMAPLLAAYGLDADECSLQPLGNGLINLTWRLATSKTDYVLQKINTQVFTNPHAIDNNLRVMREYLKVHSSEYKLVLPVATLNGLTMPLHNGQYFRLFPFVHGSHSVDVVDHPDIAFEAAKAFATFSGVFTHLPTQAMQVTLPDFHNLDLRFQQFVSAISQAIPERLAQAKSLVQAMMENNFIVDDYRKILKHDQCRKRIMHHDTKISNVLFDKNNRNMGVIDLDTVMPGYFISDVGDMMRTYLPQVSEEEHQYEKIAVREDVFSAIVAGYKGQMGNALTNFEKELFFYAALFMVYMQALRFLTDYLIGDKYYGSNYPGHNLVRAGNQFRLLECIAEKEKELLTLASKA